MFGQQNSPSPSDNLSFEAGAFIEPVSCCIHAAKAVVFPRWQHGDIGCGLACFTRAWLSCARAPQLLS
jgi:threonine dehydrogenase-like Zn-dependent dehydrogenase